MSKDEALSEPEFTAALTHFPLLNPGNPTLVEVVRPKNVIQELGLAA